QQVATEGRAGSLGRGGKSVAAVLQQVQSSHVHPGSIVRLLGSQSFLENRLSRRGGDAVRLAGFRADVGTGAGGSLHHAAESGRASSEFWIGAGTSANQRKEAVG